MMARQNINYGLFAVGVMLIAPSIAAASDAHDHAHDHAEAGSSEHGVQPARAHIHGAWELFAALDGAALTVTFIGPLTDLAGEEHPIGSAEEAASLDTLRNQLAGLAPMVAFTSKARCVLSTPVVVSTIQNNHAAHEAEERDHHGHDHDHDHEHAENDHAHDHDHHNHDGHGADIEIVYGFDCAAPDKLASLELSAFAVFDGIEQVDAVFLSDSQQVAARLTAEAARLSVR